MFLLHHLQLPDAFIEVKHGCDKLLRYAYGGNKDINEDIHQALAFLAFINHSSIEYLVLTM